MSPATATSTAAAVEDPITFEVLNNAFTAVVDDMGAMLEKVSFSTVTQVGKDYACVLATPEGDVFSSGEGGLPMLLGTAAARVKSVIETIPKEDLKEGDAILANDPFTGGTHGQDTSATMPIYHEGEIVAFVFSVSHWPDTGGPVPGSFNSAATSTHAESLMITPVHIMRENEWDRDVERLILRNVRVPKVVRGDLRGMIEALRTGRERFLGMVDKYGLEKINDHIEKTIAAGERQFRQILEKLPDGTYSFTDYIDRDPAAKSDDPLVVGIDMTIAGDGLIADFSRSSGQAIGPVNASVPATRAALFASLKAVFHEVPWNQGFEAPVEVILPPRLVVSAEFPRPVSGVSASPGEKILASVHGCMMQVVPERTMACPTNLVNICVHGQQGGSVLDGGEFLMYLWLAGGWGGRPGNRDAGTAVLPIGPGTSLQPVETLERTYPVQFAAFELLPDSEGAGKHRGGFALWSPWKMTEGRATINVQGDRQRRPGWGAEGGASPRPTDLIYCPGTDEEEQIDVMSANSELTAGKILDFVQSGGGGWGDPFERPPAWVLDDVRDQLVSRGRAEEVYGVKFAEDGDGLQVDETATSDHRAKLRKEG